MYADKITGSMERAIKVTQDRRQVQIDYNKKHGITPAGIKKALAERMQAEKEAEVVDVQKLNTKEIPLEERGRLINELTAQMDLASQNLQFEKAAALRDQIADLKELKKKK